MDLILFYFLWILFFLERSRKAKKPGFFVLKEYLAERQDGFYAGKIASGFQQRINPKRKAKKDIKKSPTYVRDIHLKYFAELQPSTPCLELNFCLTNLQKI